MKAATFQLDEVLLTRLEKHVKKDKPKKAKQKHVAIAIDEYLNKKDAKL